MRVGIMTYHTFNNYGSLLQAYALQKKLINLGIDAEVIDYRCEYVRRPYTIKSLRKKGLIGYIYGIIGPISRIPRYNNFKKFRKKLFLSDTVNKESIHTLGDSYDLYLTGSDVVWNHKVTDLDPNYFLDFVKDSSKKGSYAASFGFKEIPKELENRYYELLKDFRYFNLRENVGVEIISRLLNRHANTVLDPTLLLTKNEWSEIARDYSDKGDYILVYQLAPSKTLVKFTEKLAKEKGLKVKYISFPMGKFLKCSLGLTEGPSEWVGLIKHAKYVVSDSFHGTAFSIIFNKQFFTEIAPYRKEFGSRIENILTLFDLKNRLIINGDNKDIDNDINYEIINKKLQQERDKSLVILNEMLSPR